MAKGKERQYQSDVYSHFYEEPDKGTASAAAECVWCNVNVTLTEKNPVANLARHHNKCATRERTNGTKRQSTLDNLGVTRQPKKLQPLAKEYHETATRACCKLVAYSDLPSGFFQKKNVIEWLNVVTPGFQGPKRHKVTAFVEDEYAKVISVFAALLKAHADYKCIMFDGWSDIAAKNFLGVSCTFITKPPELERVQLYLSFMRIEGKHTAVKIKEDIVTIANRFRTENSK